MRIVGYTYEADFHCVSCTLLRFPPDEDGNRYGEDIEGNPINPVWSFDDLDGDEVCGDCLERLVDTF